MLAHLTISNFTIVDHLDMEFHAGMTVLTGETGAGKSIMLDALGLCLGDRADPKTVRSGSERAEITASFDLQHIADAQRWLRERELDVEQECILRRVITREGRSRAYINNKACTLQDCSQLGELLIDIHSQHEHQSLLRREHQRQLLDAFAGQTAAARDLEQLASDWLRRQREWKELSGAHEDHNARAQLLQYQVDELEQLNLQPGEVAELETDHKQLANAEQILQATQQALELCDKQEDGTRRALQLLQDERLFGRSLDTVRELLDSAAIQLNEAHAEIQHYLAGVEIDPSRLREVENRLDKIYDIARKHRVQPGQLGEVQQQLSVELAGLTGGDARIAQLQQEMDELNQRYQTGAGKLSRARQKGAKNLTRQVEQQLAELAMAACRFEVSLKPRESGSPHPLGLEEVEFRISTNPGQPAQALGKIASGGELSRISLAIQVVTASTSTVPSMVFDEVDVGIGGAVAEVVGRLLRHLSEAAQVLCVTHLPQVAAQGNRHLKVSKTSDSEQSLTRLDELSADQKIKEIARMLGGIDISKQAVAHATEMLASAGVLTSS
jgi:DNA repair protein RecN (Recombination protein N)